MKASVWIAQGLGIGRIPWAPGTFGSILGLVWFALLVYPANGWIYCVGSLGGVMASIALCGRAERILAEKDPASVVLDEVTALPLCFGAWVGKLFLARGSWPTLVDFFGRDVWWWSLGIFVTFRVFDVVKPWPIRQSQRFPGGWGVTLDDVLAALYVNACTFVAFFWLG